jgi:hypothetical protein
MVARGGKTGLRVNRALTVVGPLCYSPTQPLLEAAPGVTSMLEAVLPQPKSLRLAGPFSREGKIPRTAVVDSRHRAGYCVGLTLEGGGLTRVGQIPESGPLLKERISEFPVARLERTMSGKAPNLLPPSS